MSGDEQLLNPQIQPIDVGVKNLRNINIYPMSMAGQAQFGKVIQAAIESYLARTPEGVELTQEDVLPFAQDLIGLVKDNIQEILKIVTDLSGKEREEFFNDITNLQMTQIAITIVEVNFEGPAKNVLGLVERVKDLFLSQRPSQQSLNDTVSTISATSTEEVSETEG